MRIYYRGPRFGAPAFLMLMLLAAAARPAAAPLVQSADLEEGQRLLQQQRFGEAQQAFARHKREQPDDPLGYFYTGAALRQQLRLQEAAAEFRLAVEKQPEAPAYRLALAETLGRLRLWDEAIQALSPLDGANLASQTDPEVLWLLSDVYFQAEKTQDALRVLDRYDQVAADTLRSDIRRAQIAVLEGRFETAVRAFRKSLEQAAEIAPIHHGLGLALWRSGRAEQAEGSLREAIRLDPQIPRYKIDLGKVLLELDRPQEAVQPLQEAAESPEPPAEAYFELARAYRRTGNEELSRRYVQLFRQTDEESQRQSDNDRQASSAVRQGQDLLQKGQVNQARRSFMEALRQDPDNWLAHSFLAKIYLSSRQLPAAREHLGRMMVLDPDSAEGNFLWATLLYQQRDYPRAMAAARKAKQARPDYGALRNLLGNLHLALGDREKALEEYEEAVRLEPQRSDFRLNLEAARKKP